MSCYHGGQPILVSWVRSFLISTVLGNVTMYRLSTGMNLVGCADERGATKIKNHSKYRKAEKWLNSCNRAQGVKQAENIIYRCACHNSLPTHLFHALRMSVYPWFEIVLFIQGLYMIWYNKLFIALCLSIQFNSKLRVTTNYVIVT